jgi:hypothetical protein
MQQTDEVKAGLLKYVAAGIIKIEEDEPCQSEPVTLVAKTNIDRVREQYDCIIASTIDGHDIYKWCEDNHIRI